MSETYDTFDMDDDSPDDSPVIKDLRAKLRAEAKARKELAEKLAEVESVEQTRRAEAAENLVNSLGFPGLKEDVLSWVEGPLTEQTVRAALEVRGLIQPGEAKAEPDPQEPTRDAPVSASAVGQRLADAAGGRDGRDLNERIAAATSAEELAAIMEEAGLTRTHA